ncbi:MAG: glycoside hydrolase family 32 protein [Tessaracoccus sp.]
MTDDHGATRRMFLGAGGATLGGGVLGLGFLGTDTAEAHGKDKTRHSSLSLRPAYHFSAPDNWKNDPQRPIYVNGEYLYYYLYNADYIEGRGGTAWRLATTRDHVKFKDRGVAIPKFTNANGDCWSGCVVVDTQGTAGYGKGSLIAIVTQAPEGKQAQYLWYSRNGGRSFTPGGLAPVLPNPGTWDFRDPKIIWDRFTRCWVMVNAEGQRLAFYTSRNLREWTYVSDFVREDIGTLECPDLFEMTADDGASQWILGVGANGKGRDLPATYAYWVGAFDGTRFTTTQDEPLWLDWGFDFYGAVTYPHHDRRGKEDLSLRRVLGWANFWDYPHNAPTVFSDGYNGDDMIVRDLRLKNDGGEYYLASSPTAALRNYTTKTHRLGTIDVNGTRDLNVKAAAYEITCELEWKAGVQPNAGFEVRRAAEVGRHIAVGVYVPAPYAYVNRRPTFYPGPDESKTPFDASSRRVALRILVDNTSVELFVGDGRYVHSHRVFPYPADTGIRLYGHDGGATFRDLVIRELKVTERSRG